METILKTDIFFFVATVESVLITILLLVALFYFIRTLRTLNRISMSIEDRLDDSGVYVSELAERLDRNFLFRLVFPIRRKNHRE